MISGDRFTLKKCLRISRLKNTMSDNVARFTNFLRSHDVPLTKHKGILYINESFLMSFLGFTEHDLGDFDRKDHYIYAGYRTEEISVEKVAEVVQTFHRHPQQYNAQLAMEGKFLSESKEYIIDSKLLKPYKKKEEIYTLAAVYSKYAKDFCIFPQHTVLNYRTDGSLFLIRENIPDMYPPKEDQLEGDIYPSGILLEIDEKNHSGYDPEDERIRHDIITGGRYSLVRTKTGDTFKELCIKIEAAKLEQQMIFSSNIDPEVLWDELQNHCVEKDFFKIYQKCLKPDEKHCISSDDLAGYVGMRHNNLNRNIAKIMKEEEFQQEFIEQRFCSLVSKTSELGGRPKKTMYMSVKGMQLVLMRLRGNEKATKAQLDLITCYRMAFKLALALKNKLATTIAGHVSDAEQSVRQMKRREDKKHKADMNKMKFLNQKRDNDVNVYLNTIAELERKNKNLTDMVSITNKTNDLLKKENAKLKAESQRLSETRAKYMSRYRAAHTDLGTKKKELQTALGKLEKYTRGSKVHPDDERYEKKIDKYAAQVSSLEGELKAEKVKVKDLEKKVKALEKELKVQGKNKNKTEKEPENTEDEYSDIKDYDVDEEEVVDEPESETESEYTEDSLKEMNMASLKGLCREKDIKGYSKFTKLPLIQFMLAHTNLK